MDHLRGQEARQRCKYQIITDMIITGMIMVHHNISRPGNIRGILGCNIPLSCPKRFVVTTSESSRITQLLIQEEQLSPFFL